MGFSALASSERVVREWEWGVDGDAKPGRINGHNRDFHGFEGVSSGEFRYGTF